MRYFNPGFTCHPPLTVLWNQLDKTSNINLTGGLLTATCVGSGDGAVRATKAYASGKHYAELNCTTVTGTDTGAGFANTSAVLANIGSSVSGAIMQFKSGNTYKNGSLLYSNGNMSAGGIVRVAYDAGAHLAWIAFAGGNWNANAAYSPDAGTGGQDVSAFDSGGLFPCWACGSNANGDVCILNAGATSFTYSLPAGFSAWNAG